MNAAMTNRRLPAPWHADKNWAYLPAPRRCVLLGADGNTVTLDGNCAATHGGHKA
jgi:hypothetical protein